MINRGIKSREPGINWWLPGSEKKISFVNEYRVLVYNMRRVLEMDGGDGNIIILNM